MPRKHIEVSNTEKNFLITPEERSKILERVSSALKQDERIAGLIIVGSGAVDFDDDLSDIDIAVIIVNEKDVLPVFRDWKSRIEKLVPVIHSFETIFGPNDYLYGFLLEGFLELDVGFRPLAEITAKRSRWKVAFDRTGKLEEIMQKSWEQRPKLDLQKEYLRKVNAIWYYITHVVSALIRDQTWKAIYELEAIRNQAIELAGLRRGLETKHFREAQKLPKELLEELERTLVPNRNKQEIYRSLRVATKIFFLEAKELEKQLEVKIALQLETKMKEYLDFCETKATQG